MERSIYIHIPFCMKRCFYCDFVSGIYDQGTAEKYITALTKELSLTKEKSPISTLYIGGGTPTALADETLSNLLSNIFNCFNFIDNLEASIEANPGTLDVNKLKTVRTSGINRISIGVQSFHDDELSFLGRIHSAEEAEDAVRLARGAGFDNIGIDLIYGIPGQTPDRWKDTLKKVVQLKPKHISTYELTLEKGTQLHEVFHISRLNLDMSSDRKPLHEDTIIEMYEYAIDYLTDQGFDHYEISNFAIPGYECRHNLNYWDRGEYYGAGLGAHTLVHETRYCNTENLDEYLQLVSENRSPAVNRETITEEAAFSEALFLGLRKTEGIHAESLARRYHKSILSLYGNELNTFRESGLIEISQSPCSYETNIRLTRKGLILSNEIFKIFI